jgi:DNA-binding LacI/PurR family transcriptional regulator
VQTNTERVTTADVAKVAGVSRATVSYVLNGTPNKSISLATQTKVKDAARELGFVPHASARALRLGHSELVLALIPGFTLGYIFEQALEQLTDRLREEGYALLVHKLYESDDSLYKLWNTITPALVVSMGHLTEAQSQEIESTQFPLVRVSDSSYAIGRMQADYLIGKGHRRLGYAYPTDPVLAPFAALRLEGFRDAARAAGLDEVDVRPLDFSQAGVREALEHWRDLPQPPTALGAHNDDLAIVLLAGLNQLGIPAPERFALIGADDIPMARIGLSTVAIDAEAAVAAISTAVFDQLRGLSSPSPMVDLLRVVERASA